MLYRVFTTLLSSIYTITVSKRKKITLPRKLDCKLCPKGSVSASFRSQVYVQFQAHHFYLARRTNLDSLSPKCVGVRSGILSFALLWPAYPRNDVDETPLTSVGTSLGLSP